MFLFILFSVTTKLVSLICISAIGSLHKTLTKNSLGGGSLINN